MRALSVSRSLLILAVAFLTWQPLTLANTNQRTAVRVTVSHGGKADFQTIQQAVDHAPPEGNRRFIIAIEPGMYHERVVIPQDRPRVTLVGLGASPAETIITYDMSAAAAGGTFFSSTVDVQGTRFQAANLTIQNSFGPGSQAVALSVHSDRAVVRHCRLLGWQDTLYAASGRQLYADTYIEGAVDFIFGNARAVFDHCEIRSAGRGYITAQSRVTPSQSTGFVFTHCKLTAAPGVNNVYLGRPWRAYARVVFLFTEMGAGIEPAGWREWHPGETRSLDTAWYAEYKSSGPGATPSQRDPHTKFLTPQQADTFATPRFLAAPDGWSASPR